jgi:hypothetical protein
VSNPYHSLGLRYNPFIQPESLNISSDLWVDFGFSSPPPVKSSLFRQILGEKGAGKTSHLLHWQELTQGPYYYCQKGWLSWRFPPIAAIAYWDEADSIPLPILFFSLIYARLCCATIVVATHVDITWVASLCAFRCEKIHLSTLSTQNLIIWAQKAINAAQLSQKTPIDLKLSEQEAEEIVQKSQGSWRKAANYLHIWGAKSCQT